MNTVSIVVAERGSNWLQWARFLRAGSTSTIVLAQNAGEDVEDFAERVQERLRRLRAAGTPIQQAAFVSGSGTEPTSPGLQARLLRRLSTALSATAERSRLYLDATAAAPSVRRLMDALALTLRDLSAGSGLSISVDAPPGALAAG